MTFSSCSRSGAVAVLVLMAVAPAWAKDGLGEVHSSAQGQDASASQGAGTGARRSMAHMPRYSVDDVQMPDGSRIRRFLGSNGQVFAVSWHTLYKPDLSMLLGSSFPAYAGAAQEAAKRGGVQRLFRHDQLDLVVQSAAHLHVYQGYAYRRSLLPQGVSAQALGWA